MLTIVFGILKVLGILVLSVLILLLLLLFLLLFVAFGYQAKFIFHTPEQEGESQTLVVNAKVHWLLHFLRLEIFFNQGLEMALKILCFKVWQLQTAQEEIEDKKEEQTPTIQTEHIMGLEDVVGMDTMQGDIIHLEMIADLKEEENKKPKEEIYPQNESPENTNLKEEEIQDILETLEESQEKQSIKQKCIGFGKRFLDKFKKKKTEETAEKTKKPVKISIQKLILKKKEKILCACENLKRKKEELYRQYYDEQNRKVVSFLYKYIIKILRHILPRKLKGKCRFGMNDPALTGQIFGYTSIFYSGYTDKIWLEPDFEKQIVDIDIEIVGKIRLGYLVWIIILVVIRKDFWCFIKNIKRLQKILKSKGESYGRE